MHKHHSKRAVRFSSPALPGRQRRRKAFLAKWSKVDWSKQNVVLAEELGLSRERLRQIRQEIGAPKPPQPHLSRKSVAALQWAKEHLEEIKGLSAPEVGRKYGLKRYWHQSAVGAFLRPLLRNGRYFRKHRWDLMDFNLPNHNLERIWRLPLHMVGSYRRRNGRPASKWYFKDGPQYTKLSGRRQPQAYARAVRAEERKAKIYFSQAAKT